MPHRYTPSYSEQRGHSVGYIKLLIIRGRIQASNGNNKCAAVNDISRAKNHGHKLQEWLYSDRCARFSIRLKLRYLSLVPKPSLAPVFDRLEYAKTEPEGLVNLTSVTT